MTHTYTKTHPAEQTKKLLVKSILEHADVYEWSLQGFGMLRTYLAPEVRLHIWDQRYAVENVTTLHTHPWHFYSEVVVGEVVNTKYMRTDRFRAEMLQMAPWVPYSEQEIVCGPGGHATPNAKEVALKALVPQRFGPGGTYEQYSTEIHRSDPKDGTVTIIRREFLEDTERAFVYIPDGQEWVSAEPRPATPEEVRDITQRSLELWFQGET